MPLHSKQLAERRNGPENVDPTMKANAKKYRLRITYFKNNENISSSNSSPQ